MVQATVWHIRNKVPRLHKGELHLYRFRLDTSSTEKSLLSTDEVLRVERLIDVEKKNNFIASRSQLRHILSSYLSIDPAKIVFQYNQHGKPSLATLHQSAIQFNLSHSGNYGIVAVTLDVNIGVDIESIDDILNFQKLAAQFFCGEEQSLLQQTPSARQRRTFYRLWTAKEAQLKLHGTGFSRAGTIKILPEDQSHFYFAPHFVAAIACTDRILAIKKIQLSV